MAARKPRPKAKPHPKPRRKNLYIDQGKLDLAREMFEAHSETQTVEEALENAVMLEQLTKGLRELYELGGLEYFDPSDRRGAPPRDRGSREAIARVRAQMKAKVAAKAKARVTARARAKAEAKVVAKKAR